MTSMPNRAQGRIAAAPPLVLTFAASDPTGGAGLQADLMTFASLGCHGLSVVTGITVQDTSGVEDLMSIDPEWVEDQARALLEDMPVAAFKVGVLASLENIQVLAEIAADYPDIPLILDPVLASGRGDPFADDDQVAAMRELLLPQVTVLTPNSIEARRLALTDDDSCADLELAECAARFARMGVGYVLVTGTHENTADVVNSLYDETGLVRADTWPRLPGSFHGSGCTLASAIAALMANGLEVAQAVQEAQEYTWQALAAGFRPGMGQHLPDRFFWSRALDDDDVDAAPTRGAVLTRR
ncbi:hydroxymethylpyrimidine/phosphomethylpyrimidine kinase [soil metagenome]